MRYLWVCNKALSTSYVRKCLTDNGFLTVTRHLNYNGEVRRVFITGLEPYEWARDNELTAERSDYWSITRCNKQYVKNEVSGKYLGALAEVDLFEAKEWIMADYSNWYLTDIATDQTWIPRDCNPNRMIPTAKVVCPHCGINLMQTPGNRHRSQYRPWPLNKDA